MTPAHRARVERAIELALETFNRIRLPSASVLPAAGALVGVYGGLAAGVFANMIGVVEGLVFGSQHLSWRAFHTTLGPELMHALAATQWHSDYAITGGTLALGALAVSRFVASGGSRDLVKQRLRVLSLLLLAALSLYYPLVALAAINSVFGGEHDMAARLAQLAWWAKLLVPALGGAAVGWMLQNRPETRGHGLPEVLAAVQNESSELSSKGGALKLAASSLTIGSGGSAGREGPIVYGGAAFASAVGSLMGFRRQELSVLLAAGAGAGIAASFNAPIAGAIFALEIILREFKLKVFSPIMLASVTATMVSRGIMGRASMLEHLNYEMTGGSEILAFGALGLFCGLLGFAYVRILHGSEKFFEGKVPGRLSAFLGRQSLPARAAMGGASVGLLAMVSPAVWGTGHDFVNLANAQKLGFTVLLAACLLKLVGTALTIGSGGSGGTFFPALAIGAFGGGALGTGLHHFFPHATGPAGVYAMVGMGGCVAALTRGPLTGMMMVYELSGNYAVMLPLMVTCTIASGVCHAALERRAKGPGAPPQEGAEKFSLDETLKAPTPPAPS